MIVLVISCFLARFTGRPQDGGKGRTYMRKRFETVSETDKEKGYKEEANEKGNGGGSLSLSRDSSGRPG